MSSTSWAKMPKHSLLSFPMHRNCPLITCPSLSVLELKWMVEQKRTFRSQNLGSSPGVIWRLGFIVGKFPSGCHHSMLNLNTAGGQIWVAFWIRPSAVYICRAFISRRFVQSIADDNLFTTEVSLDVAWDPEPVECHRSLRFGQLFLPQRTRRLCGYILKEVEGGLLHHKMDDA